jgi:tRNA (guanine-N7-)-methyltransferase
MGKDKLKKWAENKTFPNVFEPSLIPIIKEGKTFMKGDWRNRFFANDHPIVLELGCGKGEYSFGLAQRYPDINFVGVDVKGHRFHKGAKDALEEGLTNVAFLRTRIEFITSFFGKDEVDELWLTFSDPQPNDHEGRRRITSPFYFEKYKMFLKPGGLVHIKHDNPDVYAKALRELPAAGYGIEMHNDDIYNSGFADVQEPELRDTLHIKTYYEQMWLEEGRTIKYIRVRI